MTTIYTTDAMGVFAGALDVDPYAALPPRSTLTPPPAVVGEQVARLTAGAWEVLPAYPAPPAPDLASLKSAKNAEINAAPTEHIVAAVQSAVQQRLDDFARTRAYDGILSACTYATSTAPQFAAEGRYAVQARDATWATCYGIMADVQAGRRPLPSIEQVLVDLPALEWPQ